jgi:hypothetical protein
MQNLRSLLDGFSAKEASIATGAILAALAWTLTRLADTVGSYNTLEYRIVQQGAALAGGDQGFKVQVMLSNLSGDTTLGRVHAQLSVHGKGVKFSDNPDEFHCAVDPPGWAGNPQCAPQGMGFDFAIQNLAAGTAVGFDAKYSRTDGIDEEPVLRIQLPSDQNFRLNKAGMATRALRYQSWILASFVLVLLGLLVLSIAAGVRQPRAAKKAAEKP